MEDVKLGEKREREKEWINNVVYGRALCQASVGLSSPRSMNDQQHTTDDGSAGEKDYLLLLKSRPGLHA